METNESKLGRRRALQLLGVGFTAAGSLIALDGCTKETPAPAATPPPAAAPPKPPEPKAVDAKPVEAAAEAKPAEAKPADAKPAEAAANGDLNCKDKAPIDDASNGLRKALQYKEASTDPAKKCSGCAQFEAGKYGACGGCKLFTGAVNPNGVCLSFAPKA